ncbi:cytochrome b/b6 domain-containing protein [Piscinibacter defluvii]|uniref:cytochrome b/b6 domain-containing protein n=1 Tax=Piscinibacter defluvii TaxID=1796922 RepID=UPI000FDDD53E|nr:cytochrome b/b6 domain-containing protein [Piscinibacter defluvii]
MNMNDPDRDVLVWDLPVRLFHWLLAACFAGAWLTAESEHWRLLHVTLGYTMAGLVAFRLLWGLVGTRHARFASFVRGPRAAWRYLRSLVSARPEHHAGHNPAGALAIVALLGLIAVTAASGWATYSELGGEWLEEVHEAAANLLMAVVVVHLLGVLVGSLVHRENLVRSMVTGRKPVPAGEGIERRWGALAALVLAAVLGFWWLQWQTAPAPDLAAGAGESSARLLKQDRHHDED